MNHVRKTYIEFLCSGSTFGESSTQEVKTRDVSKVEIPENAFGFKFFDILSVVVDADGEKVQLTSGRINVSPMHYYGGKLYTAAELKREFPNEHTLISSIEGNSYQKMIQCRLGNWKPFQKTDVFVEVVA